jgi:hypothetical protein
MDQVDQVVVQVVVGVMEQVINQVVIQVMNQVVIQVMNQVLIRVVVRGMNQHIIQCSRMHPTRNKINTQMMCIYKSIIMNIIMICTDKVWKPTEMNCLCFVSVA